MIAIAPLRVLFVVPNLDVGGAERHVTTLLTRLDQRRFRPSLICLGHEGGLFDSLVDSGVPCRALQRTKAEAPLILAELVREMRRDRIELVVTRSYNAEVLGRLAARLAGVPHSAVWLHNASDLRPRSRVRVAADRALDRVTSAYYAVSNGQLPYLIDELRYPPSKIHVVHNGVDPLPYPPRRDESLARELGLDPGRVVVGTVAVLRPEKDHAILLRAFADVASRCPEAVLLLVGDGPLRRELAAAAAELGIADRVVFTGARRDVPRILPLIDIFVMSSRTEAFPMALLEAMAAGLPSVCTTVGGIPEIVEDGLTGHLVPPREPGPLATRLVELIATPSRRHAMGGAARRRLEDRFGLDRSVQLSEEMLERTVGRRGAERTT
ncbi:glycosyltransferase involved in cell wall biosynthesis [Pseudonocardia sediminis]|uniref:Glycosyltransferase involved in cell wall biosynthesis n=1 Tax=Pseudonocardia sediminis TaxID=1397368 RepID=A0A4Q7V189_PSEST|nr:glycosyltransferase [Pseudonocardia sediminis]RZT87885.1 glycosyltransferase involved in cell wall biosynthesis [Pseudonocardia sediminis]